MSDPTRQSSDGLHLLRLAEVVFQPAAHRDVSKARDSTDVAAVQQLRLRPPLEDATVLALDHVEAVGGGRGGQLLELRSIRLGIG